MDDHCVHVLCFFNRKVVCVFGGVDSVSFLSNPPTPCCSLSSKFCYKKRSLWYFSAVLLPLGHWSSALDQSRHSLSPFFRIAKENKNQKETAHHKSSQRFSGDTEAVFQTYSPSLPSWVLPCTQPSLYEFRLCWLSPSLLVS